MDTKLIGDIVGWVSSIIYLIGNIVLARHNVIGWWLRIVGAIGWICVGIIMEMSSILLLETIAVVTAGYAIFNWNNKPELNKEYNTIKTGLKRRKDED